MAAVACPNPQCPEYQVAKEIIFDRADGEEIRCGGLIPGVGPCGTLTVDVDGDAEATPA